VSAPGRVEALKRTRLVECREQRNGALLHSDYRVTVTYGWMICKS
jgi:hypothetical protein